MTSPARPEAEAQPESVPAGGPLAVRVVAGPDAGRVAVFEGDVLRIGTAEGNDLLLTDPSVSPRHAQIVWWSDALVLRDLGSRSGRGTLLVGGRSTPIRIQEVLLAVGDRFQVGESVMDVVILETTPEGELQPP